MDVEQLKIRFFTIVSQHWLPLGLGVLGLIFLGYGLISSSSSAPASKGITFEQASSTGSAAFSAVKISIDVEGSVVKPGVYEVATGSRVQDAITAAGGFNDTADRDYIAKHINLAAKLTDGMKMYIPVVGESTASGLQFSSDTNVAVDGNQSTIGGLVNINSASATDLDALPGIGMVTANKIISGRPYSDVQDLLTKKIVTSKVFGQIKDKITTN